MKRISLLIVIDLILLAPLHLGEEADHRNASPRDLALVEKIGEDGSKVLDEIGYLRLRRIFRELSVSNPELTKDLTKDLLLSMPYFKDEPELAQLFDHDANFNLTVVFCFLQIQNNIPLSAGDVADLGGQADGLSNHLKNRKQVSDLGRLVIAIIKADKTSGNGAKIRMPPTR